EAGDVQVEASSRNYSVAVVGVGQRPNSARQQQRCDDQTLGRAELKVGAAQWVGEHRADQVALSGERLTGNRIVALVAWPPSRLQEPKRLKIRGPLSGHAQRDVTGAGQCYSPESHIGRVDGHDASSTQCD